MLKIDGALDMMELTILPLTYCGDCYKEMMPVRNSVECPDCGNSYRKHVY